MEMNICEICDYDWQDLGQFIVRFGQVLCRVQSMRVIFSPSFRIQKKHFIQKIRHLWLKLKYRKGVGGAPLLRGPAKGVLLCRAEVTEPNPSTLYHHHHALRVCRGAWLGRQTPNGTVVVAGGRGTHGVATVGSVDESGVVVGKLHGLAINLTLLQ
jgi:hypothetical protein